MTTQTLVLLSGALGVGGVIQAIANAWLNRRVTDADATVKIVSASTDFTEGVLARLAAVEKRLAEIEQENDQLRKQIFGLGHTPLVVVSTNGE